MIPAPSNVLSARYFIDFPLKHRGDAHHPVLSTLRAQVGGNLVERFTLRRRPRPEFRVFEMKSRGSPAIEGGPIGRGSTSSLLPNWSGWSG
jgi:hypothetical protein